MAVANFIPEVWEARLLARFHQWSAFRQATNTQYEGSVMNAGDTVRIFTLDDDVTIKNYTRNSDIASPEDLNTTEQVLTIDQEKYFNFALDDVDAVQAAGPLMDTAVDNTARKAGQTIDAFVLGLLAALTANQLGINQARAAFNLNFTNAIRQFARQNALPLSMFRIITTPNIIKKVDDGIIAGTYGTELLADTFTTGGTMDGTPEMNMGYVGRLNGIDTYVSNQTGTGLLSGSGNTATDYAWAFMSMDLALVTQIAKIEAYRPEKRFADAVKGLYVYGGKVLNVGRMLRFAFTR